jgi:hypothetical protein
MTMSLETIQHVEILKFIVHIVDHKAPNPQLFDLETPLTPDFPHQLFEDYILLALQDENRRRACFREPGGTVITQLRKLLGSPGNFLDASQQIARRLHAAMSGSQSSSWITPGDLMVALFRDRDAKGVAPTYLALLKVDLSDAVVQRIEKIGNQQRVVFETTSRVPASGEGQLHKIALVAGQRETTPEPYDLVILDQDIAREAVARFFYDQFLEADLNRSDSQRTRVVLEGLRHAVFQQPDMVSFEKLQIVNRAEEIFQKGGKTSAQALVEQMVGALVPPARQQTVREGLLASLTRRAKVAADEPVAIDVREVQKATKKLTYVLDLQVRISGDAVDVKKLVKIDPKPDAAGFTVIRIATQRFDIE